MQTATGTALGCYVPTAETHVQVRCKGHSIFLHSIFVCNGPARQTKVAPRFTKCCACHAKAVGPRRRVQVLHCRSQQLAVMSFNKCHEHPSKACHRKQIHFVRVATQVQGSYRRNTCAVRRGADGASFLGFRHGPGFCLSPHRPTGVLEPDPPLEATLQNCITV